MERDAVVFWRTQYNQALKDTEQARDRAPSVLPKLIEKEREAWREWRAAVAAQEEGTAPREAPSGDRPEPPAAGSLEEQLLSIRQMRREAQGDRSFVAASQLLKQETELVLAIGARDAERAKAARTGMSPEERVATLAARIQAMPRAVQDRLRELLRW